MREFVITEAEAGQRFDKYLAKRLPSAERGFVYKMLRKKNIVLNGKKADGGEKISAGDTVQIFFAEETFLRFSQCPKTSLTHSEHSGRAKEPCSNPLHQSNASGAFPESQSVFPAPEILYEDLHLLVVNKPAGLLSQKAQKEDFSLVEWVNGYLENSKEQNRKAQEKKAHGAVQSAETPDEPKQDTFRAGICNRLDRNTSGIVVAGKTILGLQVLSEAFRSRTVAKYYICLVKGRFEKAVRSTGYLYKDTAANKVTVYSEKETQRPSDAVFIETEYFPICGNQRLTLLKVHLITGKTHQIRAHLSYLGHPIIGDFKYGARAVNEDYKKRYQISAQMLHAFELLIQPAAQLGLENGLHLVTPVPKEFERILKGEGLWEHGIPEALEARH